MLILDQECSGLLCSKTFPGFLSLTWEACAFEELCLIFNCHDVWQGYLHLLQAHCSRLMSHSSVISVYGDTSLSLYSGTLSQ